MQLSAVKATKLEVLEFIRDRRIIDCYDLIHEFDYFYSGAIKRLYRLKKQGLITTIGRGKYVLTEEAFRRLDYHGR